MALRMVNASMTAPRCTSFAAAGKRIPSVRVNALFKNFGAAKEGTKGSTASKPGKKGAKKIEVVAPKRGQIQLGFTKDNELFVGRAAMIGWAFGLLGEVVTGDGFLSQLGYEVFDDKLNLLQVDGLVIGLIAFNIVAAFLPTSGTFQKDEEEEEELPRGAIRDPKITLANPKEFFGVKGFGFTKENELFVGRVAQLGFAASLIGEIVTGDGPLAQLGLETGVPLYEIEGALAAFIVLLLFAAVNPGTGKFVKDE